MVEQHACIVSYSRLNIMGKATTSMSKKIAIVGSFIGAFATPFLAFADTFDATSTQTALTSAYSNVGTILTYAIGVVIVTTVALMGLGYGIRILRKHATGKRF